MNGRPWNFESKFGKGVLLRIIRDNPDISTTEIAMEIGDTSDTLYKNLSELYRCGYVKRIFRNRGEFNSTSVISIFSITETGLEKLRIMERRVL